MNIAKFDPSPLTSPNRAVALIGLFVLLALIAVGLGPAWRLTNARSGAVCSWNGATGDWSDASKWSCGAVPGVGDTAVIAGGVVTVSADTTVGSLQLSVGTLTCNATLTVSEAMTWTGGALNGGASGKLASNGALNMSGSGQKFLNGGALENNGVATWLGGQFVLDAPLVNRSGATFDIQSGDPMSGGQGSVSNAGTIVKSASSIARLVNVPFSNTGTVNINAGILRFEGASTGNSSGSYNIAAGATLSLAGSHTVSSGGSVNGAGMLECAGPTFNVDGAFNLLGTVSIGSGAVRFNTTTHITTLNLSGSATLSGGGALAILNSMNWIGGDIARSGSFTIQSGAILNISGAGFGGGQGFKNLNSPLINNGVANYSGGHLMFASVFDNRAGAHFNIQTDNPLEDNGGAIQNAGVITKNSGTGSFIRSPLTNSGRLEISSTSLFFENSGGLTLMVNQTGGVTHLDNGTLGANLTINGGFLEGIGSVLGNVTNSGIISPGLVPATPGTITINKSFEQSAGGRLDIEIGGTNPGVNSDLLVTNTVTTTSTTLAGTLNVSLINGFHPAADATIQILRYLSHNGAFATTSGLDLGGGQILSPAYRSNELVLISGNGGPAVPWVQVIASPPKVRPSDSGELGFKYQLVVGNSGGQPATAVVVVKVPPASSPYDSAIPVDHDEIEDQISNDPLAPLDNAEDQELFDELSKRIVLRDKSVLIPFVVLLPPQSTVNLRGGYLARCPGALPPPLPLPPNLPEPKVEVFGVSVSPSSDCVKKILEFALDKALGSLPFSDCISFFKDHLLNDEVAEQLANNPTSMAAALASLLFDAAKCLAEFFPVAKAIEKALEIIDQINELNDVYEIFDACKGSLIPDPSSSQLNGVGKTKCVSAKDPNDKVGPDGIGASRFITGAESLRYAVFFENVPEATAPAQIVSITDQLDPALLNFNTFALGPISFAGKQATPPPNSTSFIADVDMRPQKNLLVRVNVNLNKTTGLLTWLLSSIDPDTGQPLPSGSTDGFLDPNVTAPQGEGSVLFFVAPKTGVASGTVIRNRATIVFDANQPLDTPEWLNTIDSAKPTSQVLALASSQCSSFRVAWSGADATSGIAHYSIFVSKDGGAFEPWLLNTTQTSEFFNGVAGGAYGFYSIARDGAGNVEDPHTQPDTSTNITTAMSINPVTQSFTAQGGDGIVDVNAPGGCNWIAVSKSSFISIATGASGGGDGLVTYHLDPNPTSEARQGAIAIAGQRFIVSQDAGPASTNNFPLAVDDTATTNQNTPVNIAVLANDSDPDGDALTVGAITQPANGAVTTNADTTLKYSPNTGFTGADSFTYTISDGRGGTATAAVTIRVSDTEPPLVTCAVNLSQLWPANHELINIGLTASAFDSQDGVRPVEILVFSDEDDEEPTGDGVHSPDAKTIAPGTLRLRAERKGDGDGRVYLIVVKAVDSAGNVGVCCKTVIAPRSRSGGDIAAVESQAATVRAYSQSHLGAPPAGYFRVGDGTLIGPKQ